MHKYSGLWTLGLTCALLISWSAIASSDRLSETEREFIEICTTEDGRPGTWAGSQCLPHEESELPPTVLLRGRHGNPIRALKSQVCLKETKPGSFQYIQGYAYIKNSHPLVASCHGDAGSEVCYFSRYVPGPRFNYCPNPDSSPLNCTELEIPQVEYCTAQVNGAIHCVSSREEAFPAGVAVHHKTADFGISAPISQRDSSVVPCLD